MRRFCTSLLALLMLPLVAHGSDLRLCTDDKSHMPFMTPQGGGLAGMLIQMAAKEVGVQVEFHAAPTTRCREEIRVGVAHGFPTAPYTPALEPFMAFPMKNGKPDAERAVMTARAVVFRLKASPAHWDGTQFSHVSKPVLIPFGAVLLVDRLKAMEVPADDKGKTLEANLIKLLAGRGEVAIGSETSGLALLATPQFQGKIEMLPIAFTEEPYYLGLNRQFYEANTEQMEALWTAVGRIRKTPAYLKQSEKAFAQAARDLKE